MDDDDRRDWADRIAAARSVAVTIEPMTATLTATMDDAYAIQDLLVERRVARGERIAGWKLGYTSAAMRAQMGVDRPNVAPLTDAMIVSDGASVVEGVVQPKVEPEIGLRLAASLHGPATASEARAAIGEVRACLEVVDSVWTDYRFRIEDNTADCSSAAFVVVGPAIAATSLPDVAVELLRNGEPVGSGTGAAAMGDPAAALAWLAGELAARGRVLEAGMLVITGGLTAAVPLEPGDVVSARFHGAHVVTVSRRPVG